MAHSNVSPYSWQTSPVELLGSKQNRRSFRPAGLRTET